MAKLSALAQSMRSIDYMLSVTTEKFDMDKFIASIDSKTSRKEFGGLAFAPKNYKTGKFYVRLEWFTSKQEIFIKCEYNGGTRKHADDERPPYAEEFMGWLGTFFKYKSASVHAHALFVFPLESKRSLFPLPLKTELKGEPIIDGISLRLPAKPQGISKVRIGQRTKDWIIEAVSDRALNFDSFNVWADVELYAETFNTILEDAP